MPTPAALLAAELRRDGARPFLTWYDDATGERVELSVATTANWVAKTAGFLIDEHDVQPGDVVVVALPVHWQAAVVVLAVWAVGGTVAFDGTGVLSVGTTGSAADVELSLAPMGGDFSRLVAAQPDVFDAVDASGDDVVAAAPTDLPSGARVLSVSAYDEPGGLGFGLVGPLAASGSVVLVRNADLDALPQRCQVERVTHTCGVELSGITRLGRP